MVVALAACTDEDEPAVPVVPTSPTTTSPYGDDVADDPTATSSSGIPELCSGLIGGGRVRQIVQAQIPSEVRRTFIEYTGDDFNEDSGRTARLECAYGVPKKKSKAPAVEIAASSYVDATTAAEAVDRTLAGTGSKVESQPVAEDREAHRLTDNASVSLLFADDDRTFVITLRRKVVPARAETVVLDGIALEILGLAESS